MGWGPRLINKVKVRSMLVFIALHFLAADAMEPASHTSVARLSQPWWLYSQTTNQNRPFLKWLLSKRREKCLNQLLNAMFQSVTLPYFNTLNSVPFLESTLQMCGGKMKSQCVSCRGYSHVCSRNLSSPKRCLVAAATPATYNSVFIP